MTQCDTTLATAVVRLPPSFSWSAIPVVGRAKATM
jgi:hypothetical protein